MVAKKRQHFVDQALQKNFLKPGQTKLWVYDRIAKQYREQYPSDIAVEGHIYSLDTPELKEQRYIIEDALQQLQDKALPVFEKLRKGDSISQQERNLACEYTGLQAVRTPEHLAIMKEYNQRMGQFLYEEMIEQIIAMPKAEYDKMMAEYKAAEGIESDIEQTDWRAVLDEQRLKIKQPVDYQKGMMVEAGTEIGIGFSKKHWVVLHTKRDRSFISSDVPVIQMPTPNSIPAKGLGPLAPGVANYFPFAQDAALLILPQNKPTIEHGTINNKGLHKFNRNIALNSQRIAFSGSKRLLESVVAKSGISHIQMRILFDDELIREQMKQILKDTK